MDKHVRAQPVAQECWDRGWKVIRSIGYDSSEKRRAWKIAEDEKHLYWYPLMEWGWDRLRCEQEIADVGLPIPQKSSCFFCSVMKPHELRKLVIEHPELADKIIEMERRAKPNLQKIEGLWVRQAMTPFIKEVRRELASEQQGLAL